MIMHLMLSNTTGFVLSIHLLLISGFAWLRWKNRLATVSGSASDSLDFRRDDVIASDSIARALKSSVLTCSY